MYEYYVEQIEVHPEVVDDFEFTSLEVIQAMFEQLPPKYPFVVEIYATSQEFIYVIYWFLPLPSNN